MVSHLAPAIVDPACSRFRQVCVFGGSSLSNWECYKNAAIELGEELISRKQDLIYGGRSTGLIGLVAQTVHKVGGSVLGFASKPLQGEGAVGELNMALDLYQGKAEMARRTKCFIVLHGGYRIMDGFAEAVSWAQLGIHEKPIGLININGYFDGFLLFTDRAIEDGFVRPSQKSLIVLGSTAKELIDKLEVYKPTNDGSLPQDLWEIEQQLPSIASSSSGKV